MKWIIFFDLDDTLIDTSERHYRVYKDIIEDYGMLNIVSKEEFWSYKRTGGKRKDLYLKIRPRNLSRNLWMNG